MDISTALQSVEPVAVFLAAVANFIVGSIWYHDSVFGKKWKKLVGLRDKDLQEVNMSRLMLAAFVTTLVSAGALAVILTNNSGVVDGFVDGAFIGFGIGSMTIGMHYLYEQKPTELWYINGGYAVISMAVMGLVLGLFA